MNEKIVTALESVLEEDIVKPVQSIGRMSTDSGKHYFLKSGLKSSRFACEAHGLEEIRKTKTIKVVEVKSFNDSYILMNYVAKGREKGNFFETFGIQLAQMHKYQADCFGYYEDNFIGENSQKNISADDEKNDWVTFYFNKRLLYQYRLAEINGYVDNRLRTGFLKLEKKISEILEGSEEPPSLLHGDLWNGNFLCNLDNEPVLIDPAVYYGHREADLAMTKLFGGFTSEFYESYNEEYPLKVGWEYRENLYKLYHVLNHLNLYGASYLEEVQSIIDEYTK